MCGVCGSGVGGWYLSFWLYCMSGEQYVESYCFSSVWCMFIGEWCSISLSKARRQTGISAVKDWNTTMTIQPWYSLHAIHHILVLLKHLPVMWSWETSLFWDSLEARRCGLVFNCVILGHNVHHLWSYSKSSFHWCLWLLEVRHWCHFLPIWDFQLFK